VKGRLFSVFAFFALFLVFSARATAEAGIPSPDLSKPPDHSSIAALCRSGKLPELRGVLGTSLTSAWKPLQQGRGGSCSTPSFAAWVDLYGWLDLLCDSETSLASSWASRRCHLDQPDGAAFPKEGRSPKLLIVPAGIAPEDLSGVASEKVAALLGQDHSLLDAVLGKFVPPPYEPAEGILLAHLDPEFVAATLADPVFLRFWSESFGKADFAPKAIRNLEAIWKRSRADWKEFLSLALAIALVADQKPPGFWPHQQVTPGEVPRRELPAQEQFDLWVKAARGGKLAKQPSLLSARDLMFVVDSPLDPSEFAWVRDTQMLAPRDPSRSFQSIRYDSARGAGNVLDWPHGPYRLERIREFGGICVDQAYYAATLAKAVGIPALLLSGQGRDGGHAWIGFMKGPQMWDFGVGRYREGNYGTGFALDPQSWNPISDHELALLVRPPVGRTASAEMARRDLAVAGMFQAQGDGGGEGRALQSALETSPENPAIWDAVESWLLRTNVPRARLTAHHESAMRQFERFPDLRNRHREALIRIALEAGDRESSRSLALQIIHENKQGMRGARADLAARAAWVLVAECLKSGDPSGAVNEADRMISLMAGEGGGEVLYRVVDPLVEALIGSGQSGLAQSFLMGACRSMRPSQGSLVAQELLKLWDRAGGDPRNPEFGKLR
jgi:hypothetical protein